MKTFKITFRDGTVEEVRATEFLQGPAHVVFFDGGAQVALVAAADIRIVRIIEASKEPPAEARRRGGKAPHPSVSAPQRDSQ
jgi:hypothetical protein